MFDIGFSELLVIGVIALVVMGPERLPETVRTISLWIGRMKQKLSSARQELENEVGMDEIRRQLQNEKIMRDLDAVKEDIETTIIDTQAALDKEISDAKITLDNELSDARAELDEDLEDPLDDQVDSELNEELDKEPSEKLDEKTSKELEREPAQDHTAKPNKETPQ
jgi:sec-independent protein translocase protein TatB|tara:strand:+ start:219 stop:719 length:501 start_codon:yes stop_codon:yes gene_type:complete